MTPRPIKPVTSSDKPICTFYPHGSCFLLIVFVVAQLDKYTPKDIAEQLTYIDSVLFNRIPTEEIFGMKWTKDQADAPNLTKMSERWNLVRTLPIPHLAGTNP